MNLVLYGNKYWKKNGDVFVMLDKYGEYCATTGPKNQYMHTTNNESMLNLLVNSEAQLIPESSVKFESKEYWPKVWVPKDLKKIDAFFYQKNADSIVTFYLLLGDSQMSYWQLSRMNEQPYAYDITMYSYYKLLSLEDSLKILKGASASAVTL